MGVMVCCRVCWDSIAESVEKKCFAFEGCHKGDGTRWPWWRPVGSVSLCPYWLKCLWCLPNDLSSFLISLLSLLASTSLILHASPSSYPMSRWIEKPLHKVVHKFPAIWFLSISKTLHHGSHKMTQSHTESLRCGWEWRQGHTRRCSCDLDHHIRQGPPQTHRGLSVVQKTHWHPFWVACLLSKIMSPPPSSREWTCCRR